MNNRVSSEKGFSLIELLVVVAIIGVLAAVGVVGYQGYIDSTKKSVTDANAKAVHQWLVNSKTVRAAGIDMDPAVCGTGSSNTPADTSAASAIGSSGCFGSMAGSGAPFESFKNPYDTARTGSSAIYGKSSTSSISDGDDCDTTFAGAKLGDVIVRVSGTVKHIDVYFCAKDGDGNDDLTKRDSTIKDW
ncbi:MAG: type II secretion system protein [Parvibaculales bacterium]